MFETVHPSPTARKGSTRGKDLPDDGGTKGNESRFVFCRHCGWRVDQDENPKPEELVENPISYATDSYTHPHDSSVTVYTGDPTVGGPCCPFCGSRDY